MPVFVPYWCVVHYALQLWFNYGHYYLEASFRVKLCSVSISHLAQSSSLNKLDHGFWNLTRRVKLVGGLPGR